MDLRLRPFGLFSNVNEVVNACHLVELGELEPFYVDGRDFLFRDAEVPGNPWEYYYEQPFPEAKPLGHGMPDCCRGFITPYYDDQEAGVTVLFPPMDRAAVGEIIKRYLRPVPAVVALYEGLRSRHQPEEKAACLIRGPGKLRDMGGSVLAMHREIYGDERYVEVYFDAFNDLEFEKVLIYSDAESVLESAEEWLGDRAEWTDTRRCWDGEYHHEAKDGHYQLGLEMAAEALLMADSACFVHGSSNIANFVLCANPALRHVDVYAAYYDGPHPSGTEGV